MGFLIETRSLLLVKVS